MKRKLKARKIVPRTDTTGQLGNSESYNSLKVWVWGLSHGSSDRVFLVNMRP
jgi:hypothetical protein